MHLSVISLGKQIANSNQSNKYHWIGAETYLTNPNSASKLPLGNQETGFIYFPEKHTVAVEAPRDITLK